jgi:uncharacterized membrane protein YraQ (UPF0718 family)
MEDGMRYLYMATGLAVLISLIANREKTFSAINTAFKKFVSILPAFLVMLILVSIVLFLVPDRIISHYLDTGSHFVGVIVASVFGSITLMPGFIAFPLCGILLRKGVTYMVLSAFSTTLMMVGVLTYPIEKEYFGAKVTIIRNAVSFFIAIFVALITGVCFGEIF